MPTIRTTAGAAPPPADALPHAAAGLTTAQAADVRRALGPNRLPVARRPPWPWALLRQMSHLFALLLWAAAGLALLGGMPQLSLAIGVVVVLNGVFAFLQEHRADRAAEALRDLLPQRATVRRDGAPHDVPAEDVVDGDVLLLSGGDRVPADGRVLETHGARVDTSTLTGESRPVRLEVDGAATAGSYVVEGEAEVLVTATGARTRLGGLSTLASRPAPHRTPLALELHRVVRVVALVATGVGASFFVVSVLLGVPASDGFLFAVGVTVALVPEGLLPTVTLSLAHGAQLLSRRSALVRRLEAVETLGSTTFICTDKTGTLTQNRMAVVDVWTPRGSAAVHGDGYAPEGRVEASPDVRAALGPLALAGRRCSAGRVRLHEGSWIAVGDPMEAALDAFARRVLGEVPDERAERRFAFDPRRRRSSALVGGVLSVKGAPEGVLPLCTATDGSGPALAAMLARGLRVLAVATRTAVPDGADVETAERDLQLLGLVGLEDPPRETVPAALEACRRAGIRVAVVTGDHGETARAIAEQVGLWREGSVLVDGTSLPADDAALGELVDRDGAVVCRVDPEDKLRIARALRARGHVVAMTGDGVNDGPALREADIGVAMGASGTDVARQAADLVLLDDDFATIVVAVEQGRATFANIKRFLTYHLTDNVAEVTPFALWALTGSTIPLALGVLQVLCLDIASDMLPALALGTESPSPRSLDGPPVRGRLLDGPVLRRAFGVLGPTEALVEMTAFCAVLLAGGWRLGDEPSAVLLATASGAAFSAVVAGQLANAVACRSRTQPVWRVGLRGNPALVWALVAQAAVLVVLLLVPPLAEQLGHRPPSALGWAVALSAAPAVVLVDGLHKHLRRRNA